MRLFPDQAVGAVGAEAGRRLGDIEQCGDQGQVRSQRLAQAQLVLFRLDRRQHLVAVRSRLRRDAGLLQAGHPAGEEAGTGPQVPDGRGVVEGAHLAALRAHARQGVDRLLVAGAVQAEPQLQPVVPQQAVVQGARRLVHRVQPAVAGPGEGAGVGRPVVELERAQGLHGRAGQVDFALAVTDRGAEQVAEVAGREDPRDAQLAGVGGAGGAGLPGTGWRRRCRPDRTP